MSGQWAAPMSTAEILELLTKVKAWGYKGVSINVSCWVSDPFSSVVFRLPGVDLTVADWRFTASDEQLSSLLDLAEQAGLDAEVKKMLQLYVSRAWDDQTGDYSASMRPNVIVSSTPTSSLPHTYAGLLSSTALCCSLPSPRWTVSDVRDGTSKGLLHPTHIGVQWRVLFEESTHHYLDRVGFSLSGKLSSPLRNSLGNSSWRNPQGRPMVIEWSCWTPRLESQNDQRLSVLVGGMLSSWSPALDYYRAKYPVNTIRFGEIGTFNTDGVARGGDYFYALVEAATKTGAANVGIRDAQEVADIWAAYVISAIVMRLQGLSVWDLELSRGFSAAYNQGRPRSVRHRRASPHRWQ